MINEHKFIDSIKRYDVSGLDFEPIDSINEIIAGTMRPFKKRGMNENEFTLINIGGFEVINDDSVLNLFNIIPPGPKEMERHRTHLAIGRFSQCVLPVMVFNFDQDIYVLVQKRKPLNLALVTTVELFRDYVNITNGKYDFDKYFNESFKGVLAKADHTNIKSSGYYWEASGIMSTNICAYICTLDFNSKVFTPSEAIKILNTSLLREPNNIIGRRELDLLPLEDIKSGYQQMIKDPLSTVDSYFLNDTLSINGLFCLFRHLDKKGAIT